MIIPFLQVSKGTGNDFVIINGIENQMIELDTTPEIQHICSRKFGVGSDGLIIIKKSNKNHFKMDFIILMVRKVFVVTGPDVQYILPTHQMF